MTSSITAGGITFPARDNERTGYEGNLTTQQSDSLASLKEKLKSTPYQPDLDQNPDGDRFILRFMRATMQDKKTKRIFDVEAAQTRIIETLEWRRKYNVDTIRGRIEQGEFPAGYLKYRDEIRPRLMFVDPQTGRPVQFERFGQLISHVDVDCFTEDEWIEYMAYDIETKMIMMRLESAKRGYEVSMQILLLDLAGGGLGALSRMKLFKILNKVAGQYYPEFLGPIFVMNAPWFFAKSFGLVKPFMDPDTVSKLIVESGIPKEKLLRFLPAQTIPKEYGGDSDSVLIVPLHARKS